MERSHAGLPRRRRSSDIGNDAVAASEPGALQKRRRRIPYGLGLLFLALVAGLAAALFLTMGTAGADVLLVGANAAF